MKKKINNLTVTDNDIKFNLTLIKCSLECVVSPRVYLKDNLIVFHVWHF